MLAPLLCDLCLNKARYMVAVSSCNNPVVLLHCVQKKNTHSRFLLYSHGKCLDFHKIFRECLGGNRHSTGEKITYSLLLVMSYCHHIFVFVNYGFYR